MTFVLLRIERRDIVPYLEVFQTDVGGIHGVLGLTDRQDTATAVGQP